jgi:hypothetical protein
VRPLGSLRLAIAVAGRPTRQTHVRDCGSASLPFCAGSATVFDGALAQCHGSGLLSLRLPFAHKPAVSFLTSPTSWKFTSLACLEFFPVRTLTLSRLSASFVRRIPLREPPELSVPCWRTVATVYPLGNCDSSGLETCPDYLTRLGTVSSSHLAAQSLFRVYRWRANAIRGTGEFCLPHSALRLYSRGDEPTSPAQPFPSRLGLSSELASSFFRRIPVIPVLSMN